MKKVLPAIVLASLLAMPIMGFADVVRPSEDVCTDVSHDLERYIEGCSPTGFGGVDDSEVQLCCILDLIETVVDWMFVILLVVAGFIIILAAYQFLTASGAPEKVNSARDKLIWALVGVAVAFLAKGMVKLVEMMLT